MNSLSSPKLLGENIFEKLLFRHPLRGWIFIFISVLLTEYSLRYGVRWAMAPVDIGVDFNVILKYYSTQLNSTLIEVTWILNSVHAAAHIAHIIDEFSGQWMKFRRNVIGCGVKGSHHKLKMFMKFQWKSVMKRWRSLLIQLTMRCHMQIPTWYRSCFSSFIVSHRK